MSNPGPSCCTFKPFLYVTVSEKVKSLPFYALLFKGSWGNGVKGVYKGCGQKLPDQSRVSDSQLCIVDLNNVSLNMSDGKYSTRIPWS